MFEYKARIVRVVDGDTFDAVVDLGFGISFKERFRLAGVNTPETYGVKKDTEEYKLGIKATKEVERLCLNKDVIIQTARDTKGKYGRYIANVFLDLDTESAVFYDSNLSDHLVKEGFAQYVAY